jgi:hypothetical protein
MALDEKGITARDILTDKAIENAMVVHAAFGGSTNLLLHIPAIAHAAKCRMPDVGSGASTAACRLVSAAQRAGLSPDGARVPCGRRTGSDAPPAAGAAA